MMMMIKNNDIAALAWANLIQLLLLDPWQPKSQILGSEKISLLKRNANEMEFCRLKEEGRELDQRRRIKKKKKKTEMSKYAIFP